MKLARRNIGLRRGTWSIFCRLLFLVRLCELDKLNCAFLGTFVKWTQVKNGAVLILRQHLHYFFVIKLDTVPHHNLESEKSAVYARIAFQYLDGGRLLD